MKIWIKPGFDSGSEIDKQQIVTSSRDIAFANDLNILPLKPKGFIADICTKLDDFQMHSTDYLFRYRTDG